MAQRFGHIAWIRVSSSSTTASEEPDSARVTADAGERPPDGPRGTGVSSATPAKVDGRLAAAAAAAAAVAVFMAPVP